MQMVTELQRDYTEILQDISRVIPNTATHLPLSSNEKMIELYL